MICNIEPSEQIEVVVLFHSLAAVPTFRHDACTTKNKGGSVTQLHSFKEFKYRQIHNESWANRSL
jgi:hypothetical protein